MRRLLFRNTFMQKMLLSIVALICIPMIFMQLYMIVQTNREFKQENTTYYQKAVQSMALSFENQLSSISATAYRMRMDTDVTWPVSEDLHGYNVMVVADKISSYGLDSPLIHSLGVYYTEKNMVLYNGYRYSLENACNRFYSPGTEGHTQLTAFLNSGEDSGFFYTGAYPGGEKEYLIVSRTILQGAKGKQNAVAFFVLEYEKFQDWGAVFVPIGEDFAILDENGKYLIGQNGFAAIAQQNPEFSDFLGNYASAFIPADNSAIIIYKYRDISSGYTYVVSAARDTAEATFAHYTAQATGTMVATVVLTAILLFITVYINYLPVHKIVTKHIGIDSHKKRVSELELIDSRLFAQDEQINSQNNLLASFLLGDILSGVGVDVADIDKHFPEDTYHSFAVAITTAAMTTAQSAQVCRVFSGEAGKKLVITAVPYRTELVFVHASESPIDLQALQNRLCEVVFQVLGEKPEFRMGTVVESALELQKSYNSALLIDSLSGEIDDTRLEGYPNNLVTDFAVHVSNGDWSDALCDLDGLEEVNRELKPSVKRFVHLKVLNYYLTGVSKGGHILSDRETNHLLSYTNGQHLFNMMRRSIAGIQKTRKADGEENTMEQRKKLLDYVNKNFSSSQLCLTSAADYLKTSIYTVSRIFKETTGSGFKEYITEKRLQHACLLLRQSNMAIADIAAACGFENANYFTAIFRNKFGIVPSKYRIEGTDNALDES